MEKNAIPKMSYLVDILTEAGFQQVRTYIQSGNIILESDLDLEEIRECVHTLIKEKIGADLKMVIKNKSDFKKNCPRKPVWRTLSLWPYTCDFFIKNLFKVLPLEKLKNLITVKKKFVSVTIVFTSISLELQNKRNSIPTILKNFSM